jgi:alpha-1,6-mannosyltransferase
VRVVHVANAYTPRSGGIRTTVHALGHGYQAAGHEFVLVVPGPRAGDEYLPWGRRVTLAGPRVPGSGGYRVLADLRRVRAILDSLAPDRLEVSDRLTLRGLGRWAGTAGVPSTVIAHERVDGLLRVFSPLGARAAQLAADRHNARTAQCFDRVVTTTGFAAQEFDRIKVPTDHVPLGVDLEQFRPATHPPTPDRWRPSARALQQVVTGEATPPRRRGPAGAPPRWPPGPARGRRVRPARRVAEAAGSRAAG